MRLFPENCLNKMYQFLDEKTIKLKPQLELSLILVLLFYY